mgnify:FL=1|tara:strand:- start:135 stop:749 length:615 start_codon:yes stop_codon:yes gene_type:complete
MFRINFILFLFVLFASNISNAQESFKSGVYFGPNVGQIRGDGYAGFNKIGGQIGGFVSHDLKNDWDYVISIGYINKGSFKPSKPDQGIFDKYLIILNYAEAKFTLRKQISVVNLDFGPYLGILFTSSVADENGKLNNPTYNFRKIDFGGFIGISYPLNDKIIVSLTNEQSLWPMANSVEFVRWFGIVGGSFNNVLAVNFHYHFK